MKSWTRSEILTLNAADRLPGLVARLYGQAGTLRETLVVDSSSDNSEINLARNLDDEFCKSINCAAFNHEITRDETCSEALMRLFGYLYDDVILANTHLRKLFLSTPRFYRKLDTSNHRDLANRRKKPSSLRIRFTPANQVRLYRKRQAMIRHQALFRTFKAMSERMGE